MDNEVESPKPVPITSIPNVAPKVHFEHVAQPTTEKNDDVVSEVVNMTDTELSQFRADADYPSPVATEPIPDVNGGTRSRAG